MLNGERILNENMDKIELTEASTIYDGEGNEIKKIGVNRELMDFTEMPELLVQAFIATEDRRFYEHNGIDFWSIGRAAVKDIIARDLVEGGSTITQQLAKNLFLDADKTFFRKATEASIALALENNKSKEQILELYLNRIYFGKGAYGVKAAAKVYFNKDLGSGDPKDELELWEIATLAGIPKAPNNYNPLSDPERSKNRRAVVLKLMYEQKLISMEEMEEAAAVDYVPPQVDRKDGAYQTYIDYVLKEAVEVTGLSEDQLILKGYDIYTSLDTKAQETMESAFNRDDLFQESGPEQIEQAAMVIVDQHNGEIVAMAGGRDYVRKGLNRVTVQRQPGSSFKPLAVYAPALETGKWSPQSTLRDEKRCFGDYCPTNIGGRYRGSVTMSDALKDSLNLATVWLLDQIGLKTGLSFVESLGIALDKQNDRNLSIALGGLTHGVTPLEMAQAYSAFANGGEMHKAHSIREIRNSGGDLIYSSSNLKPKRVMSEQNAYLMTEMLQRVVTSGTGKNAKMDRPVAGKTGTTQLGIKGMSDRNGNRDVWFVGYTPEWTAAVWMGFDRTDSKHYLKHGSGQAAKLFSVVMSEALAGKPKSSFPVPDRQAETTPQKPAKVEGLKAVYNPEENSVFLTWTPTEGLGYRIYKKGPDDAEFYLYKELAGYMDEKDFEVQPGYTYAYYVTAVDYDSGLESEPSEFVQTVIPKEEQVEPEEPEEPELPDQPVPDVPKPDVPVPDVPDIEDPIDSPVLPELPPPAETPGQPDEQGGDGVPEPNGQETPSDRVHPDAPAAPPEPGSERPDRGKRAVPEKPGEPEQNGIQ
jgi:penicillin-binding protein 2A